MGNVVQNECVQAAVGRESHCFQGLQAMRKPKVGKARLTTGYWAFRGVGAPMRMICAYCRAESTDVKYEVRQKAKGGGWIAPTWEKHDKPDLQAQNPLISLPFVVNHTTGEVVSQSIAVSLYLGRLFGMNGQRMEDHIANEQVLCQAQLLQMEMKELVYPSQGVRDEDTFMDALEITFDRQLPNQYAKLEAWLRQRGTSYFVSVRPCTADFHVWEIIDQYELMAAQFSLASPLEPFELLESFHERFRCLPQLRAYFESEDSRLPVNNKMAFFK